jgi:putative oxidoreductase
MNNLIFKSNETWAGLISRITAGLILLPHGAQKMLGLFGGYGFTGTMNYFTNEMHFPWILGFIVILIEFAGSIALILGAATRIWSLLTIVLMLGIIFTSHLDNGFFMNWFGNQQGEGFEFHLIFIGLTLITFINGGGRFSVDRLIYLRLKSHNPA